MYNFANLSRWNQEHVCLVVFSAIVEVSERKAVWEGRYWKVEHKILNSGHSCEITRPLLDKKADCDSAKVRELAPNTVERLGKTNGWRLADKESHNLAKCLPTP